MKLLFVLLSIFVVYTKASISEVDVLQEQWELFKIEHKKIYSTKVEETIRYNIFRENLHKINEHNKKYHMGLSSYTMRVNHLADLSEDEFLRLYTIDMPTLANKSDVLEWETVMDDSVIYVPRVEVNETDLEGEKDWRKLGAVTSVKYQGYCGSCWSFSAAGALEGQWFLKTQKLIDLSEQNLVDCSGSEGNYGCRGGRMTSAFEYIRKNGGIDSYASYPYEARDNWCRFNKGSVAATVSKTAIIPEGEDQLLAMVSKVGPIAVAMHVIDQFRFPHKGVFDEPSCGTRYLDHAVLVVGYGNEGGKDYWLVKNSWGESWGDKGYIKMVRNKGNQCGIASDASFPLV